MPAADDDPLLTLQEVAEIIGCTRRWVTTLVSGGGMTTIHFGPKFVRVRLSDLNVWIEERTRRIQPGETNGEAQERIAEFKEERARAKELLAS